MWQTATHFMTMLLAQLCFNLAPVLQHWVYANVHSAGLQNVLLFLWSEFNYLTVTPFIYLTGKYCRSIADTVF